MGFVVFVAGYHAFQNIGLHLAWFALAVAWPVIALKGSPAEWVRGRPLFMVWATAFVVVMLGLSLRPGFWPLEGILALLDGAALLLFLRLSVRLGERGKPGPRRAMAILVVTASVPVVISVIYGFSRGTLLTSRFDNVIVHFGLAPVLTGLLCGSAGLAAAVLAMDEGCRSRRWLWLGMEGLLFFGALATHSRGTFLALAVAFLVLVVVRFGRALVAPLLVLGAVVLVYLLVYLIWPKIELWVRAKQEVVYEGPLVENPVAGLVKRKDGGRLKLYQIILARMDSPWDHVLGRGRWAEDGGTAAMTTWAHHPHSVYLATYYRGGAVGLGLLGVVMLVGTLACWRAARRGEPLWLVLAVFGAAALLVDGDDLTRIASLPRLEPLLLWFPLAVGAGFDASRERRERRRTDERRAGEADENSGDSLENSANPSNDPLTHDL